MTQGTDEIVPQEGTEWYVREIELSYGPRAIECNQLTRLTNPPDVVAACRDMKHKVAEQFRVLMLDGRHRLVGWKTVSEGTLTASLVHPREVFMPALIMGCGSILIVHNHPSGDASPSKEDKSVTTRLKAAGELLGVTVLDHLIIGHPGWSSAQQEGWL